MIDEGGLRLEALCGVTRMHLLLQPPYRQSMPPLLTRCLEVGAQAKADGGAPGATRQAENTVPDQRSSASTSAAGCGSRRRCEAKMPPCAGNADGGAPGATRRAVLASELGAHNTRMIATQTQSVRRSLNDEAAEVTKVNI